MSIRVRKVVVWRTEVENRPGTMARALEPLAEQDLDLVIGYQGAVIDIAPVLGRKATTAAKCAGFKPLPTAMILVEGKERPGVYFIAAPHWAMRQSAWTQWWPKSPAISTKRS
jgi:hypothetical protein